MPTFDGFDLRHPDALLPVDLLRRWAAQLCHVLICLHSRGVIIQVPVTTFITPN
jgi:serine/threonine protein kinase